MRASRRRSRAYDAWFRKSRSERHLSRALADARFAKAAMALTAGTEILAFMFMLVIQ